MVGWCRGIWGTAHGCWELLNNVEERWFASRFKKEFWKIERMDLDIIHIYVHTYSCVSVRKESLVFGSDLRQTSRQSFFFFFGYMFCFKVLLKIHFKKNTFWYFSSACQFNRHVRPVWFPNSFPQEVETDAMTYSLDMTKSQVGYDVAVEMPWVKMVFFVYVLGETGWVVGCKSGCRLLVLIYGHETWKTSF